jgi:general L-amino acid transport system permease protein
MTHALTLIPARPAPTTSNGILAWLRNNLFASISTTIATFILGGLLLWLSIYLIDWALLRAVTDSTSDACRAIDAGACWGAVLEKHRLIIFGRYPFEAQWRPLIATVLMLTMIVISCIRACWKPWLLAMWILGLITFFMLMYGNISIYLSIFNFNITLTTPFDLETVDTDRWGGFPLTVLLSTVSIGLAFPIAMLVALGRASKLPAIKAFFTAYVELIRGVPLISVLFMASFMLPLFMPQGFSIDVLFRVIVGITLFTAAYMAEVIRGGLQAIPKGQVEAAATLGLSYWQTQRKIVIPQALAIVIPSLMNNFIAVFIDTSLVTTVSLYELMGAHGLAFNSDADWRPYKIEGYIFVAAIYFIFCLAMARYSAWVEKQANKGRAR